MGLWGCMVSYKSPFIFSICHQKPAQSWQHLDQNYFSSHFEFLNFLKIFQRRVITKTETLVLLLWRYHHFSTAIHLCACCQATPDTLGMQSESRGYHRVSSIVFQCAPLLLMSSSHNKTCSALNSELLFVVVFLFCFSEKSTDESSPFQSNFKLIQIKEANPNPHTVPQVHSYKVITLT